MASKIEVVLNVVDQASRQIDKVQGRFARFGTEVKRSLSSIGVGEVLGGLAVGTFVKSAVQAAAELEQVQMRLRAMTGSSEDAAQKMRVLDEMFGDTAICAKDAAQAYVRLRSLGIDPTAKQMETLGGISLLFGETIEDVAKAVNNIGTTGSVKQLRALGIEITKVGDKAVVKSGDVRRVVENDNGKIREAVFETWAERFPNAIEEGSNTAQGQLQTIKNMWEDMLESIGAQMLPAGAYVKENFDGIRAFITGVVAAVRIAFNGLETAVDIAIDGIMTLGKAVRVTFTAIVNGALIVTEPIRMIVESLGSLAARVVQVFEGIANRDWGQVKAAAAGIADDLKQNWSEMTGRIKGDWQIVVDEFQAGARDIEAWGNLLAERTGKNFDDIADAMLSVSTAYESTMAKTGAPLGKGTFPGDEAKPTKTKTSKTKVDTSLEDALLAEKKRQIELQEQIVEASNLYVDVIKDNLQHSYEGQLALLDAEEAAKIRKVTAWQQKDLDNYQWYEDMKTAIHEGAAKDREAISETEANSITSMNFQLGSSLLSIGETIVESTAKNTKKQQEIMLALALIEIAGASVKAIYDVWQDDTTDIYTKIGMTAGVVAQVVAEGAAAISAMENAYARGTSFSSGGMALVGEEGPELVTLPRGSRVYTNYQTRNTTVGGDTVHLHFDASTNRSTVDYAMDKLDTWRRQQEYATRRGYLRYA